MENHKFKCYLNTDLVIKAKNKKTGSKYKSKFNKEYLAKYELKSIEIIFQILYDLFAKDIQLNLELKYDQISDEIILNLTMAYKYFQQSIDFKLTNTKKNKKNIRDLGLLKIQIIKLESDIELLKSENKIQITKLESDIGLLKSENKNQNNILEYIQAKLEIMDNKNALYYPNGVILSAYEDLFPKNPIHLQTIILSQNFLTMANTRFPFVLDSDLEFIFRKLFGEKTSISCTEFKIINNKFIKNLNFIKNIQGIKFLNLISLQNLTDISEIIKLPLLTNLTINCCDKITNLDILDVSKSITILKINKSTGLESDNFKVEYI